MRRIVRTLFNKFNKNSQNKQQRALKSLCRSPFKIVYVHFNKEHSPTLKTRIEYKTNISVLLILITDHLVCSFIFSKKIHYSTVWFFHLELSIVEHCWRPTKISFKLLRCELSSSLVLPHISILCLTILETNLFCF